MENRTPSSAIRRPSRASEAPQNTEPSQEERVGEAFAKTSWDWVSGILGKEATPQAEAAVGQAAKEYARTHPLPRGTRRFQWAAAGIMAISSALSGCEDQTTPAYRPDISVRNSVRVRSRAEAANEERRLVGTESRQTQIENELIVETRQTYDREVRRTIALMTHTQSFTSFLDRIVQPASAAQREALMQHTASQIRQRALDRMTFPTSVSNTDMLIQRVDQGSSYSTHDEPYTLLATKVELDRVVMDHRLGADRAPEYQDVYDRTTNHLPGGLDAPTHSNPSEL